MSPPVEPVVSSPDFPEKVDVVVIGGGVAGVSTALALARRGVSVALCEKGVIAGEQSSRNWGWCRAMGRDTREIPLIQESLRLWKEMNTITGEETGHRVCGILYLCETPEKMGGYNRFLEQAKLHQIDSRLIGPQEVAALVPGLTRPVAGGLYTPGDSRAEPSLAVPAMARAVQRLGGTVLTQCAVRTIDVSAGRVSGVVTERGRIACSSVVLAGGAWSRLFAGNLDVALPQLKVRSSVFRTAPLDGAPEISAAGSDFSFRKRLDGGYTVAHGGISRPEITPDSFRLFRPFLPAFLQDWRSLRLKLSHQFLDEWRMPRHWSGDAPTAFEAMRVLDPAPDQYLLDQALAALKKAIPAFGAAQPVQSWAGMIDVTPDAVPVISDVPSLPGFFISTGFSGHGFGLGPGAGRLMADLVTGSAPVVDPAPFRFSRFSDGTPVVVETGF